MFKNFDILLLKVESEKKSLEQKSCGLAFYISVPNYRTQESIIKNFEIFAERIALRSLW